MPGPAARIWSESEDLLLGTVTDAEAAAAMGLSKATVARRRRQLSISPHSGFGRPPKISPEAIFMLGKQVDAAVAKLFDVGKSTVHSWRMERGIPARRRK